jgi:DNA topoisomerase I
MKLVIVESPAKCKKIESYLGPGYKCVASFGHIRQLGDKSDGLKCIDIQNNFTPTYKNLPNKSKNIKLLRDNIKKASEIILATDDDREGEAIAWHICKLFNLPVATTKRIIFHEITKTALQKAVKQSTVVDMNKVHAQQARQILDKLVGFTLSPILYENISRNVQGGLSAGRCQTPALRLVYEQELEIQKSPGDKMYETEGDFGEKNITFKLNYNFKKEEVMVDFLEENSVHEHIYSVKKPKEVKKKPPIPFTTSGLQQKSSNELGYSPKQTMRLAQTLYEAGYITYMRTDSKTYSAEFIKKTKIFITNTYDKDYVGNNLNSITTGKKSKSKKKDDTAQEAHEAIRPTDINRIDIEIGGKIKNQEKRLYKLIWKNTIQSCMSDANYNSITAEITAPRVIIEGKTVSSVYRCSEEKCLFPGWKVIDGVSSNDDFEMYEYLKKQKQNSRMTYNEIRSRVILKNLKSHYTEAKLVNQLEKMGIGRPSTFSSLVSKIQERNYVKKGNVEGKKLNCTDFRLRGEELDEFENYRQFGNEKNKLILEPLGLLVIEFLLKWFDQMFIYDYTKVMEDDLDKIANGNKIWYTLCDGCYGDMIALKKNMPKKTSGKSGTRNSKKGIYIDDKHTYMIGKYGPCLKYDDNGEVSFKKVKKDLDMNKLKNGEYSLQDVLDTNKYGGNNIGIYKQQEIVLKNGKFGKYLSHNGKNYSVKGIDIDAITLEEAIRIINTPKTSGILKEFKSSREGESISIRTGKYGPYIYFKNKHMTRPRFINLGEKKWKEMTLSDVEELMD